MSRFDLGDNIKKPKTVPATAEGFWKRVDSEKTGRICAELADVLEQQLRGELSKEEYKTKKAEIKQGDTFYTPHAHFNKAYKSNEGEPVDSGKAVIDLDGCADFEQLYERFLRGHERELGINMVNRSVSGTGGHVLFDIPEGMDRQTAQAWMSHEMGDVEYDKAVHEPERAIYLPCREYILYIDEELMFSDELHPAKVKYDGRSKMDDGRSKMDDGRCKMDDGRCQTSAVSPQPSGSFPTHYHGIPFEKILKKYWEVNNHGFEPTEGDRDTLTFQLASDLRHICGKSFEWLDQVIPCYDGFPLEEKRAKIRNALASKYEGMPQRLRDTLAALDGRGNVTVQTSDIQHLTSAAPTPPEMPEKKPKLIQLLISKTPKVYQAAVAHAVFPPLATHLKEVRFCYTDNVEHEATLMNCLMAGTGAGKGCIDKPIEHIMADIERRDKENERREAEWKNECLKKGANKDKPLRPEGLVIQIIDPDMTKPALVTRMDESEGHFVYVKLNELDLFEQLKGATGKQHFQLMCLAFDSDSTYGQTRVGTQSVTARPMCRFNWNACTTILKGRRFFSKVLTDGPISRINFCTIPEQEIGAPQPIYGEYDLAFDEALKPYIDNLVAARGLIACPQAYRLAKELLKECSEFAQLSQNDTYWNLSHRACVIAWLKACVLYVANGQKWEKSIENFTRWSLNYDLWCKMMFFGDAIERATNGDDSRIGTRGPQNMMTQLADEFTLDDVKRICQKEGKDPSRAIKIIRNWMNRNYLIQNSEFSFQKSEKFNEKVING